MVRRLLVLLVLVGSRVSWPLRWDLRLGRRAGQLIGSMPVVMLGPIRLVLPSAAVVYFHPIILAVLDLAGVLQGLCEEVSKVVVVGCIFEPEAPDIREVLAELLCVPLADCPQRPPKDKHTWIALAQLCYGRRLLLLADFLVLLLVGGRLQALPWKPAA